MVRFDDMPVPRVSCPWVSPWAKQWRCCALSHRLSPCLPTRCQQCPSLPSYRQCECCEVAEHLRPSSTYCSDAASFGCDPSCSTCHNHNKIQPLHPAFPQATDAIRLLVGSTQNNIQRGVPTSDWWGRQPWLRLVVTTLSNHMALSNNNYR